MRGVMEQEQRGYGNGLQQVNAELSMPEYRTRQRVACRTLPNISRGAMFRAITAPLP